MTADQDAETAAGPVAVSLTHLGRPVADYLWQPTLPEIVSPRPHLHPVRTLAGTEVTEQMPADHRHHLGVSVAVADVAGTNFWGGRTYVATHGSVLLPNHGTQRHHRWLRSTPSEVVQELWWTGPDGVDLLSERRRLAALPLSADTWALDFTFELTNIAAVPLAFASPATNGRSGAGYGGFFWRAPRAGTPPLAFGPDRGGEKGLHGRSSPWVGLTGTDGARAPWTLIFVPADPASRAARWFVRTRDYPGVGSAMAWDHPLLVPSGGVERRRIITVVADGTLPRPEAAVAVESVVAQVADEEPWL